MMGAIAGDIIGSAYERHPTKNYHFDLFLPGSRFTDDTVLTIAVADCILNGKEFARLFKEYGRRYRNAGYGSMFIKWLGRDSYGPYNSFGNGSAMRVSPVGFAYPDLDKVLKVAEASASVTHNHPEGIKGAQAIAAAVFLANAGESKEVIRKYIEHTFSYSLRDTIDNIRPRYRFNSTCQGSVPQAIIAFLDSDNYEDAVRKAVSLGGDSDTLACMAGGIAQAYYREIPQAILDRAREALDEDLLAILDEFNARYGL